MDRDTPMRCSPFSPRVDFKRESVAAKRVSVNDTMTDSSRERESSEGEIEWIQIRRRSAHGELKQAYGP